MTSEEALERLLSGNEKYLTAIHSLGLISPAIRKETAENGQHPYAVVVTCADSRVIPEAIFSAGIGELFVIRVAGNVIGAHELGSIEYALEHLGCRLVVVLGHTQCGAVGAAIHHEVDGHIQFLVDAIRLAIGSETDDVKASCLNACAGAAKIREAFAHDYPDDEDLRVTAALYYIDTGRVEVVS